MSSIVSLVSQRGLADTVLLTVAARELNVQYPGEYRIQVHSNYPALFAESTHISANRSLGDPVGGCVIDFRFDTGKSCHALVGVLDELDSVLGTDTRLTEFRPSLFLDVDMQRRAPSSGGKLEGMPYWLFSTGGDYHDTTSWWDFGRWQELVTKLAVDDRFPLMVHVGAQSDAYRCRKLQHCVDLHGRTNLRELIWLVRHCNGVITTGRFLSHVAAALGKPCVVLAGGRRSRWHQGYTSDVIDAYCRVEGVNPAGYAKTRAQQFMDIVGKQDCCADDACNSYSVGERGDMGKCQDVITRSHYSKGRVVRQTRCMTELDINWVVGAVRYENSKYKEKQ